MVGSLTVGAAADSVLTGAGVGALLILLWLAATQILHIGSHRVMAIRNCRVVTEDAREEHAP